MNCNVTTGLPIYSNHSTYAGNDSANRAIAHGLGRVPNQVTIGRTSTVDIWQIFGQAPDHLKSLTLDWPVTTMDATNFYAGNVGNYGLSANSAGAGDYIWTAL